MNLVSPRCQKKVSKGIRPSPLLNGDVQLIRGDFIHYIPSIQKEFEGGFLVCVMVLACSFPVKKTKSKVLSVGTGNSLLRV